MSSVRFATGLIPAVRLAEKVPRSRPLKMQPEDLALRIPVYVGPTGTVVVRENVWRLDVEFGDVLDEDDSILFWNEISQYLRILGHFYCGRNNNLEKSLGKSS